MSRSLVDVVSGIVVGEDLVETSLSVPLVLGSVASLETLVGMLEGQLTGAMARMG